MFLHGPPFCPSPPSDLLPAVRRFCYRSGWMTITTSSPETAVKSNEVLFLNLTKLWQPERVETLATDPYNRLSLRTWNLSLFSGSCWVTCRVIFGRWMWLNTTWMKLESCFQEKPETSVQDCVSPVLSLDPQDGRRRPRLKFSPFSSFILILILISSSHGPTPSLVLVWGPSSGRNPVISSDETNLFSSFSHVSHFELPPHIEFSESWSATPNWSSFSINSVRRIPAFTCHSQ